MTTTLFHQPSAGEKTWTAEHLMDALGAAGIRARYCDSGGDELETMLASTRDLALVAGGDGSVARIATALPDRSVPLALLPLGSANNIARSLGCFGEVEALIAGLSKPGERPLPVGEVRGRWGRRRFVEAVGMGALSRSTAELQDAKLPSGNKRQIGRDYFARHLAEGHPIQATVFIDGACLDDDALLIEVVNIPMIGPNLRLGSDLPRDDGRLSVAWLPTSGREEMLAWIGDPEGRPPPLRRLTAGCVELETHHREERVRIDDKTVEWDGSRLGVTLEGRPVRVLVPEGAGA